MSEDDVVVLRRASVDDYESVINILDDLWHGHDYLPTLYHVLLQTQQHVFYVAEINGRLVTGRRALLKYYSSLTFLFRPTRL